MYHQTFLIAAKYLPIYYRKILKRVYWNVVTLGKLIAWQNHLMRQLLLNIKLLL